MVLVFCPAAAPSALRAAAQAGEMGLGAGQTWRSADGQNEERKSLRDKGADFGKGCFLTDPSLVSRQLLAPS